MKDKVKQLAEQAGFMLWNNEEWKPEGQVVDWSSDYDKELEEFAELIVRECMECSDPLIRHYIDKHPEQEQAFLLAAIADYSSEIKKHFGVKL